LHCVRAAVLFDCAGTTATWRAWSKPRGAPFFRA